MLRFQQIMSSMPKEKKDSLVGGLGMDEFGETEEIKQQHVVAKQDSKLEKLKLSLEKRLNNHPPKVDAQEMKTISDAINRVQFPYSTQHMQNFLYYINVETANLLARSKHPIVSEWGNKCTSFYSTDPLNKHVQPETGLVVAQKGGINHHPHVDNVWRNMYTGNGVWNLVSNSWVPSPGSYVGTTTDASTVQQSLSNLLYTGCGTGYRSWVNNIPPIRPPDLSKVQLKLISPILVAALIGDKKLMEDLRAKGAKLEDDNNEWHITPLEIAILCEHTDLVDFMFQQNINKAKALKIAVEKCSFTMIEKLVNCNAPITDEVIELARKRDQALCSYLEIMQKDNLQRIITNEGPYKALQTILDYPEVPIQSLVELICQYPDVINTIPNAADGNTILHQLVIAKDPIKVQAFMTAILEAKSLVTLSFDIEKKNKKGQTVLSLALFPPKLTQQEKDVVSALILYGNPSRTSVETEIANANIIIPEINRKREQLEQAAKEKMSRLLLTSSRSEIDTNRNLAVVAAEVEVQKQQNVLLMGLVQTLFIECQEAKRENAEIRALLQATHPQLTLPAPASPTSQHRNRLFAITNQEVQPLNGQQKLNESEQGVALSPRRQMNGAETPH